MSDETPAGGPDRAKSVDLGKPGDAVDPAATPPPSDTPSDTPARTTAPRPTTPGAAASRRARQLGGPRRPSPQPRPAEAHDRDAPTAAATTSGAATTTPAAKPAATAAAKPATTKPGTRSGVGARRPRPTAVPADDTATDVAADAVAADTDDTTADAEDTAATPDRPRGRRLVVAGAVLAVALLAVGVVFLVLTVVAKPKVSAAETERALASAKSDVALVTTYGYQTIDDDAAKAAAVLTGQFRSQYLDSIQTVVKPQLPTTQTVTTGQVDTAGLVSADAKGRQVVVLVYGQQSVTNKAQTTPRIDAFQIRVTMQLVGGRWLVSQLEQLGNNA